MERKETWLASEMSRIKPVIGQNFMINGELCEIRLRRKPRFGKAIAYVHSLDRKAFLGDVIGTVNNGSFALEMGTVKPLKKAVLEKSGSNFVYFEEGGGRETV